MARNIALDGATVYKVIVTTVFADDYPERKWGLPQRLAGTVRHEAYGPYLKESTAKSWGANEANRINRWNDDGEEHITATYRVVSGMVAWYE